MAKSKIIALTGLITALLLMPVPQARAVDYDGPEDGGSLIGAVRLMPEESYVGVPELLERYIKEQDKKAWKEIKEKIDYTYRNLGHALWPVLQQGGLEGEIKAEIDRGKKLFFKPNLVNPLFLSPDGDGSPGPGVLCSTDWAFVAALMRFFHDKLSIRYYQMALGEASQQTPTFCSVIGCSPEALMEGTPFGEGIPYYAGWCMYWVRKYLAETTTPHDSNDDPMNGYMDSIVNTYVSPGEATAAGKLMVYDLNNAEWFDRGREVRVPRHRRGNYKDIIVHKALIGDPGDRENYPGSVLINCPILKIHAVSIHSNAIKNLGFGGWPMYSGHDGDAATPDWLYSYPPDHPPGVKGPVYHDKWYVVDADDEGVPLEIAKKPNFGLDGSMVDMCLAIRTQIPCILHVTDAIKVINIDHFAGVGEALVEGLVFASTDPVALDLLCARYMFKNLPMDPNAPDMFARGVPVPRYDENWGETGAIVTDPGVELRVGRSLLFDYAETRGLGKLKYHVDGVDKTSGNRRLVSREGHFGKIEHKKFVEIMTEEFYFDQMGGLWDLQPTLLAHAQASDQLPGSDSQYHAEFMAFDEDGNGVIEDREFGTNGLVDCALAVLGITYDLIGKGEAEHATFFQNSRFLKYSDPAWNVGGVDILRVLMDAIAFSVALGLATDEATGGMDPFFGIPYGAVDGMPKWPSLQFARYGLEMSFIYDQMYPNVVAYSDRTEQGFTLYVPSGYNPGGGLPGVVETAEPAKVFTVEFTGGEVW